jgi:hypothetical protein
MLSVACFRLNIRRRANPGVHVSHRWSKAVDRFDVPEDLLIPLRGAFPTTGPPKTLRMLEREEQFLAARSALFKELVSKRKDALEGPAPSLARVNSREFRIKQAAAAGDVGQTLPPIAPNKGGRLLQRGASESRGLGVAREALVLEGFPTSSPEASESASGLRLNVTQAALNTKNRPTESQLQSQMLSLRPPPRIADALSGQAGAQSRKVAALAAGLENAEGSSSTPKSTSNGPSEGGNFAPTAPLVPVPPSKEGKDTFVNLRSRRQLLVGQAGSQTPVFEPPASPRGRLTPRRRESENEESAAGSPDASTSPRPTPPSLQRQE